jgi:methylthioribose-1-phosphate isomerase
MLADEDAAACRAIGEGAAPALAAIHERAGRAVQILTHCNAGWLACVEWGTATAPVYVAHERGVPVHVWVSETRPRNQGALLTAWELGEAGVPHTLVTDAAAAGCIADGEIAAVLVSAERIAANGDVIGVAGTYPLALAAAAAGVPFLVLAATTAVDLATAAGADAVAEQGRPGPVLRAGGERIAPEGTQVRNPRLDLTPASLVTAIVTEAGVVRAPFGPALAAHVGEADARRAGAPGFAALLATRRAAGTAEDPAEAAEPVDAPAGTADTPAGTAS